MATKSKKSKEITIRSSAAEYLTFVSAIGDQPESVELRYQDENIKLRRQTVFSRQSGSKPTVLTLCLVPLADAPKSTLSGLQMKLKSDFQAARKTLRLRLWAVR